MNHTSIGRRAVLGMALGALGGCAALSPGEPTPPTDPAPSPTPTPDRFQQQLAAATRLVATAPGVLGIVVRDRVEGTSWRAGRTDHPTWTASTIKLAIATGLLERARAGEITLDAKARGQIADMLDFSSDPAATALWNRYGRDSQVPRFRRYYGMTGLTFVDGFARSWGHMKCTTEDLLKLIIHVLTELHPQDRAVLVDGMRTVGPIQRWGVWAAGSDLRPGTKNGWSIEPDGGRKHWVTNTVGFAGPDERYAVAAMLDLPAGRTIGDGVHAVSDVIATVFGAPVPAPGRRTRSQHRSLTLRHQAVGRGRAPSMRATAARGSSTCTMSRA
ncbi:hypothetical protein F4553_007858 [Allocatelliglobosispora scoriae]|uniref:Serine hydrolase n=1 Tax=Allocatelliglobosispora scoriae TaxID=643052 RepID=A0A841C247_9ACTN|nr:hypothetical protein [Allocatelliglobosispora scoriae]MBB5874424.1 hypothetical protein [Allocatelliglobosispora scoriae]